jgi:uncharacterized protein YndB with AHSA1/START domain
MPTVRASRELLASRNDVWAFVSDPYNLPNWWPRVAGVQPDRRGLAPGARWHVQGRAEPTLLRRPEAVGSLLVREVQAPERLEFHLTGDRLDVELVLENAGPARTRATVRVEGPWLVGLSRALPRQVLGRLYTLLQTGAA